MIKFIQTMAIIFILSACAAQQVPVAPEQTTIPLPRISSTVVMPSAIAETVVPTNVSTNTPIVDTSLAESNQRFSPIDRMPQVLIPEGSFRMGGMDARSAPDERP